MISWGHLSVSSESVNESEDEESNCVPLIGIVTFEGSFYLSWAGLTGRGGGTFSLIGIPIAAGFIDFVLRCFDFAD